MSSPSFLFLVCFERRNEFAPNVANNIFSMSARAKQGNYNEGMKHRVGLNEPWQSQSASEYYLLRTPYIVSLLRNGTTIFSFYCTSTYTASPLSSAQTICSSPRYNLCKPSLESCTIQTCCPLLFSSSCKLLLLFMYAFVSLHQKDVHNRNHGKTLYLWTVKRGW